MSKIKQIIMPFCERWEKNQEIMKFPTITKLKDISLIEIPEKQYKKLQKEIKK